MSLSMMFLGWVLYGQFSLLISKKLIHDSNQQWVSEIFTISWNDVLWNNCNNYWYTNTKYYNFHVVVFIQFITVNTIKHKLFVFLFTFFVVFEIYSMLGYDVEFGLIILIFVDFLPQSIPLSFSATVSDIHFLLVFNFFLSVLCTWILFY